MTVRAKFYVQTKTEIVANAADGSRGWKIEMMPVWEGADANGDNIATENHIFSKATPSGSLEMFLTNKAAADQFTPGQCVYNDFSPAGAPAYRTAK